MLSRTADHLFWMSRYTERAENTARMLNVSHETSLLPQSHAAAQQGWQGLLSISELLPQYTKLHGEVTAQGVMDFMVKDESNPSSIVSCLGAARENARAVRGSLTTEVWETLNQTWLEIKRMLRDGEFERDPGQFFEWVKFRSHLSRGVTVGTMLMDEAFHFLRLGTFLERADNTARLLDVKFHAVENEFFGSTNHRIQEYDFYHWSAVLRSVKTFWNVASEKGLRVGVVNWWATWPADAVNGWIVTDRAAFKLEKGGAPDREVYPAEAFDRLRPLLEGSEPDRARRLDRFHLAAARALRADAPPDLEALYLPGLDIFTMQQLGEAPASDLAGLDSKLAAVRDQYRFVDGLIAEAVAQLGPNDILVLVGDPGRLARGGTAAAEGLLALFGAPVAPGDLGTVSERDVAPTVLHLLGLPKSRELDGRVLESALSDAFRRDHPVRLVDSYGRRPPSRAAESDFDQDVLEQLKSLGYIQ